MLSPGDSFSSLVTQRMTRMHQLALTQTFNRLASGSRINSSADGPAALIESVQMDSELAGLESELSANTRAMSIGNTVGASLDQMSDMLNEAKSLVAANANDAGTSDAEKQANQLQIDSILNNVDRIANTANFAGRKLLDGTFSISASGDSLSINSARTSDLGATEIDGSDYSLSDLGSGKSLDTTGSNSIGAASVLDAAIKDIATQRGEVGAFISDTLQPAFGRILSHRKNLLGALSSLRDADYAMEAAAKVRAELLGQSSLLLMGTIGKQQHLQSMLFSVLG